MNWFSMVFDGFWVLCLFGPSLPEKIKGSEGVDWGDKAPRNRKEGSCMCFM
jgi:hypothetical protein